MSRLFQVAKLLDDLGQRRLLSKLASFWCADRTFEIDDRGRWINVQQDMTIVSPLIHVSRYQGVKDWVIDNWLWDYSPATGDIIIDVGAGIGEETVVFAKLVGPSGLVVAIEAHPDVFDCLKETVRRSNLTNVVLVQCAIADVDGELEISSADCHVASSVMAGGGVKVPARSLDSLRSELGLDSVQFIKMNIEGAEKMAVRGMHSLFERLGALCVSCHDFVAEITGDEQFRSKAAVQSALQDAGYAIRTRPDSPHSWVRDYLYARRP